MDADRSRLFARLGYVTPADLKLILDDESSGDSIKPDAAQPASADAYNKSSGLLAAAGNLTEASAADLPPLDEAGIELLLRLLDEAPGETMQRARRIWDSDLTEEQLRTVLHEARASLKAPGDAVEMLEKRERVLASVVDLPEPIEKWFPGYVESIPIDAGSRKFEPVGDALGWAFLAGPYVIGSWTQRKAPFRWHNDPQFETGFRYEMKWKKPERKTIALFSDFGTGLYHSRYIAKQIAESKVEYAVHLGDVYYAGRSTEFAANFDEPLRPVLENTALFAMPGNHEMYSAGVPYFAYLDAKIKLENQKQEGSYFCLWSDDVQIVGLDTDYWTNFRCTQGGLQDWLQSVLNEGRQKGRMNVLLTGDEPYEYGKPGFRALFDDLRKVAVEQRLVDLWFWGNTHYCALFDQTNETPFIGSCIGHGGFPYGRMSQGNSSVAPAPARFLETRPRFPEWTGVRQDRGNNGFCFLDVIDHGLAIRYVDWMGNRRADVELRRSKPAGLQIGDIVVYP